MDWYRRLRPLLFRLAPETAHDAILSLLTLAQRVPGLLATVGGGSATPSLERRLWDLTFPNPVGLAAGFDKNGRAAQAAAALGFGFIEVGTVTPQPQPGHPRPRIWRLPDQKALVNWMGFNNQGAEALRRNLSRQDIPVPVGINIGKNQDTPNDEAAADYRRCLAVLFDQADYFTVNISSPNTPGLRRLHGGDHLRHLLAALRDENERQAARHRQAPRPLLLKLSPDLDRRGLEAVVATAVDRGVDGLIVCNTTTRRTRVPDAPERGGLSGRPLRERATAMVADVTEITGGGLPLVGVGGVAAAADAQAKLDAGADLVQLYTGLIYGGPGIVETIKGELRRRLANSHAGEAAP